MKQADKKYAEYLINALKHYYKISEDKRGEIYYGISLKRDYNDLTLDGSIPGDVKKYYSGTSMKTH